MNLTKTNILISVSLEVKKKGVKDQESFEAIPKWKRNKSLGDIFSSSSLSNFRLDSFNFKLKKKKKLTETAMHRNRNIPFSSILSHCIPSLCIHKCTNWQLKLQTSKHANCLTNTIKVLFLQLFKNI